MNNSFGARGTLRLGGRTYEIYRMAALQQEGTDVLVRLAAKEPYLQGAQVVIAERHERIQRSNLPGMGILPLQFMPGESADSPGLPGVNRWTSRG